MSSHSLGSCVGSVAFTVPLSAIESERRKRRKTNAVRAAPRAVTDCVLANFGQWSFKIGH